MELSSVSIQIEIRFCFLLIIKYLDCKDNKWDDAELDNCLAQANKIEYQNNLFKQITHRHKICQIRVVSKIKVQSFFIIIHKISFYIMLIFRI